MININGSYYGEVNLKQNIYYHAAQKNNHNNALPAFHLTLDELLKHNYKKITIICKNCHFALDEPSHMMINMQGRNVSFYFYDCTWRNFSLNWSHLGEDLKIYYHNPGFTVPKDDNRFIKIKDASEIPNLINEER